MILSKLIMQEWFPPHFAQVSEPEDAVDHAPLVATISA
jgi:hypothetical protein